LQTSAFERKTGQFTTPKHHSSLGLKMENFEVFSPSY